MYRQAGDVTRKNASRGNGQVSRGRARRLFVPIGILLFFLGVLSWSVTPLSVMAQGGNPPNQPRRGMIYDGLTRSQRKACQNGYDLALKNGKRPLCTHGPDPVPEVLMGVGSVPPVRENRVTANVVCDGDGMSGKRFQVLYVHASDVPDQYATYLSSIQQWIAGADDILNASAAETGGTRHFRFVHDAGCVPVVQDVTVSATGDDTFGNLITELQNQGFSNPDRNYAIFADSQVYCGIATIVSDDTPWSVNAHNTGSYYARVDARCWGPPTIAHEMMHNLGGVQLSAPHSSQNWHCTDAYDEMCYQDTPTTVLQYPCPLTHSTLFDCNHDDYFNTNPTAGSYLGTHWDTAYNAFLVYPHDPLGIASLLTGSVDRQGNFVTDDSFKPRDTVYYRAMLQDAAGAPVTGARVTIQISQPDGTAVCTNKILSDAEGTVSNSCALARTAPLGTWKLQVLWIEKPGADFSQPSEHVFRVSKK